MLITNKQTFGYWGWTIQYILCELVKFTLPVLCRVLYWKFQDFNKSLYKSIKKGNKKKTEIGVVALVNFKYLALLRSEYLEGCQLLHTIICNVLSPVYHLYIFGAI